MKPQNHGIDTNLRDFQHHMVSVDFYPGEPQASLKSCDHSLHLPHGAEDQSRGLFSQSTEKPHMVTPRVVLPPDSAASRRQVLTDSRVKYSLQPRAGPLKVSGLS